MQPYGCHCLSPLYLPSESNQVHEFDPKIKFNNYYHNKTSYVSDTSLKPKSLHLPYLMCKNS